MPVYDTQSLYREITSAEPNPFVNQFRNFSGSIPIFRANLQTGCGRSTNCLCSEDKRQFEMSKNHSDKKIKATKHQRRW
jgi:hypothetical protein